MIQFDESIYYIEFMANSKILCIGFKDEVLFYDINIDDKRNFKYKFQTKNYFHFKLDEDLILIYDLNDKLSVISVKNSNFTSKTVNFYSN
jgi:hypothetical protein